MASIWAWARPLKRVNQADHLMATRPQTLYDLTDSPIGLAAWILDHGDGYDQPAAAITSAVLGRTAYHNLIYYNKVGKGGHFAAWEQPQLFAEEVRAGFRPLRK
ncbi:MAG TPA: hypothetical protein VGZ01_13535 [Trinickia sp.]|nr:hypothetical protein [Trinickia sp.]